MVLRKAVALIPKKCLSVLQHSWFHLGGLKETPSDEVWENFVISKAKSLTIIRTVQINEGSRRGYRASNPQTAELFNLMNTSRRTLLLLNQAGKEASR